jgi:hypothetical protein
MTRNVALPPSKAQKLFNNTQNFSIFSMWKCLIFCVASASCPVLMLFLEKILFPSFLFYPTWVRKVFDISTSAHIHMLCVYSDYSATWWYWTFILLHFISRRKQLKSNFLIRADEVSHHILRISNIYTSTFLILILCYFCVYILMRCLMIAVKKCS